MNRADTWVGQIAPDPQRGNQEMRSYDTARLIAARPYTIVVQRDKGNQTLVTLAPQVVRLEVVQNIRSGVELRDAMVAISKQYVVIIGYKDHPTIPNTDLRRADTFVYNNREWEIVEIIDTIPGRLMCSADLTP
jgi:hypothetical protein